MEELRARYLHFTVKDPHGTLVILWYSRILPHTPQGHLERDLTILQMAWSCLLVRLSEVHCVRFTQTHVPTNFDAPTDPREYMQALEGQVQRFHGFLFVVALLMPPLVGRRSVYLHETYKPLSATVMKIAYNILCTNIFIACLFLEPRWILNRSSSMLLGP